MFVHWCSKEHKLTWFQRKKLGCVSFNKIMTDKKRGEEEDCGTLKTDDRWMRQRHIMLLLSHHSVHEQTQKTHTRIYLPLTHESQSLAVQRQDIKPSSRT